MKKIKTHIGACGIITNDNNSLNIIYNNNIKEFATSLKNTSNNPIIMANVNVALTEMWISFNISFRDLFLFHLFFVPKYKTSVITG